MITHRFYVRLSRDVEKIMHTPAYKQTKRRKTQVFSFRAHDDITRRGLMSKAVCRVAHIDAHLALTLI